MPYKMISLLLFSAILLMIGCVEPRTINNLNLDNPDAPLRSSLFQIDGTSGGVHSVCTRDNSVWFAREGLKYNAETGVHPPSVWLEDGIGSCGVTSNSIWGITR